MIHEMHHDTIKKFHKVFKNACEGRVLSREELHKLLRFVLIDSIVELSHYGHMFYNWIHIHHCNHCKSAKYFTRYKLDIRDDGRTQVEAIPYRKPSICSCCGNEVEMVEVEVQHWEEVSVRRYYTEVQSIEKDLWESMDDDDRREHIQENLQYDDCTEEETLDTLESCIDEYNVL